MFDKKTSQKHPAANASSEKRQMDAYADQFKISANSNRYRYRKTRGLETNGYFDSFSSAKHWYGRRILPLGNGIPPVYITKSISPPGSRTGDPNNHYLMGVFLGPSIGPHIPAKDMKSMTDLKEIFAAINDRKDKIEGGIIPIKPLEEKQSSPAAYFATPLTLGTISPRVFRAIMGFDRPSPEQLLDFSG